MKNFFYILILFFCLATKTSWAVSNAVYIYNDEGVGQNSLIQTIKTLEKALPQHSIKTINAEEVISNDWAKDAVLFVIPGGADLPYVKKLNGTGNKNIKTFIESGGAYLGICAGAYYASSYVEFDKGGELEVLGDRELAFFPGKSIGPVLAKYDYKNNSGARAADIGKATVYYNGGGYFENTSDFNNVSIIAKYKNDLSAIIHVKYGKGNAVLSGVHFETDPDTLNKNDPYLKNLIPILKHQNQTRLTLTSDILEKLNLKHQ